MEKRGLSETAVISNFDKLLKEFNRLWETEPKAIEKFKSLKEKAKLIILYPRQMDAIVARCNNVISGNYGNSKKQFQ